MQGTHIFFKTKEDAIHFAEKQGMYPATERGKERDEKEGLVERGRDG